MKMPWDTERVEGSNLHTEDWNFQVEVPENLIAHAVKQALENSLAESPPRLEFASWSKDQDGYGHEPVGIDTLYVSLPCFADERGDMPLFKISLNDVLGYFLERYTDDQAAWADDDKGDLAKMRDLFAGYVAQIEAIIPLAKTP